MAACPNCGEANPAHARFCFACGTPLDQAAPPREVRKTVTIIFSDVVDSTPLGEQLDAETYRRVISRYFIEVSRVLERHGGTVISTRSADGLMRFVVRLPAGSPATP